MARITCLEPSTGRPLRIALQNLANTWTSIADAPDFSVPDEAEEFATRDPLDATRAIRPGEITFLTPLCVSNRDTVTRWVDVRVLTEAGVAVFCPGRVSIPAGDTVYIPVQGRSLLKRTAAGANGDRLQVLAQTANVLDLWLAAEEKLSSEHVGVV